jgi:WD40 repeat protein
LWECDEGGGVMVVFRWGFALASCWKWSEVTVRWQVCTLTGHTGEVNTVAFSADGTWVVSASDDKLVKIWDAATGAEVSSFVGVRCGEAMGVFCGFRSFHAGFALEDVCGESGVAGVHNDRARLEDSWTLLT